MILENICLIMSNVKPDIIKKRIFICFAGEDGVEGSGPGTDLQGEEGDCVDEDGPVSPSERGCAPAAKEDEDGEASDEEDDEEASPPTPPPASASARLNPTILRDTGPPDRYSSCSLYHMTRQSYSSQRNNYFS